MSAFAIIGYPASNSLSPALMSRLGLDYRAIDLRPEHLARFFFLEARTLDGFNITHPHKARVIPFLHELSSDASVVGAVNCVVKVGNKWVGHNTDHLGVGFVLSKYELKPLKALILGTGGAARAAAHALRGAGADTTMVSRDPSPGQLSWTQLSRMELGQWDILVNATPLELPDVPLKSLNKNCFVFDMNYKPADKTPLVKAALSSGLRACDGFDMLIAQHSWNLVIWLGGSQELWLEKLQRVAQEVRP